MKATFGTNQRTLIKQMKELADIDISIPKIINRDLINDLDETRTQSSITKSLSIQNKFKKCRNYDPTHVCNQDKTKPNYKMTKFQMQLMEAAKHNDTYFVKKNMFRFSKDQNLHLMLYNAVLSNNLEFAKLMLNLGARINYKVQNGNTSLHKAIEMEDFRMIKMLIQMGADPYLKNNCLLTPLEYGDYKILKELQLLHLLEDDNLKS